MITDTKVMKSPFITPKTSDVNFETEFAIKDISGQAKKKLPLTVLYLSNKTPDSTVFPKGSVCRTIKKVTINTPGGRDSGLFSFEETSKDRTKFTSLSQWKTAQLKEIGTLSKELPAFAGKNASYPVLALAGSKGLKVGILYSGSVYNVSYLPEGDASSGSVAVNNILTNVCVDYNKVASDFIEKTIKTYEK